MKKTIIVLIILVLCFSNQRTETIRMRIIANSNSKYDQDLKYEIKDNIENFLGGKLTKDSSIEDVRKTLTNNLDSIDGIVNETLPSNYNYNINYGINYFPKKENYEAGEYESLVITLGEGKGDNWWCILFPPMCLIEAEDNKKENIKYDFYFKKIINKIINIF